MVKVNPIQLQKYLKGVNYPVSKADLLERANQNGVDDKTRGILQRLPDDQYTGPTEVNKAVGELSD